MPPTKPLEQQINDWNANAIDVILHKVTKIDVLIDNHQRLEATMEKMADAVSRLAVIEERQNADRNAIRDAVVEFKEYAGKINDKLDRHDARIDAMELADVENKRMRNWGFAIVSIVGLAVLAKVLGLIGLQA